MTIINPNSISGISSITALNSTAAINLFKADGTAANIIAGVTTGTNFKTGSSNLHNVGIEIAGINVLGADTPIGAGATIYNSGAALFTGNLNIEGGSASLSQLKINSTGRYRGVQLDENGTRKAHFQHDATNNKTIVGTAEGTLQFNSGDTGRIVLNSSGHWVPMLDSTYDLGIGATRWRNVYADTLYGSGANLTNLPAQATIANNADNRVITGGSGVNLNGEANLTFDGSKLTLAANSTAYDAFQVGDGLFIGNTTNNVSAAIFHQGGGADLEIGSQDAISFTTGSTAGNATERVRIYNDGVVAIGQSSKSSTIGAGNLDIQGNGTSCIIEMGNPFPTFSGGIVPEFRITATNSGHTVDFESVWGGDNLLHKHLSFSGGVTAFYKGTTSDEVARFNQNNFGVGTQSPGQLIHTHSGSSSGGLMIQSNGSTNYIAAIQSTGNFINGSTPGGLAIRSGNGIEFSGNDGSSVQMRLDSSSGNLTIGGSLVVSSGKGIDFSASGGAGGVANHLLDDYEEGSWTPSFYPLSSNIPITYTTREGKYTKIGNVVYWHLKIQVSNITGNRNQSFGISGFPHNITNSQGQASGSFYGETWDGEIPTTLKYFGNVNRGQLYYYADAMKYYSSSMLDINVSSSMLMGSGFYYTH